MHLFSPHMVQNSLTGIVHALLAVCVIRLYTKPQVNKLPLPCSTAPCHRHVLPINTYNELIYPPTQTIHAAKRSYVQTMLVLRTRETPLHKTLEQHVYCVCNGTMPELKHGYFSLYINQLSLGGDSHNWILSWDTQSCPKPQTISSPHWPGLCNLLKSVGRPVQKTIKNYVNHKSNNVCGQAGRSGYKASIYSRLPFERLSTGLDLV